MAGESTQALARTAKEIPDHGLLQYHFGSIPSTDTKILQAQAAALEKAVQLLPTFGRAYAELARVYALSGKATEALPLLERALELEPEFADRFYEIQTDVFIALKRHDDAFRAIKLAEALPHDDRKATEAFTVKVMNATKRIENSRRSGDAERQERIRRDLERKVNEREPVQPPVPPPPIPPGRIDYEIVATAAIEVISSAYPEYPEELRQKGKAGKITLRVELGTDGTVRNAVVTASQVPEMNAMTVDAVKKWTFKVPPRARPGPLNITLTFNYALQ